MTQTNRRRGHSDIVINKEQGKWQLSCFLDRELHDPNLRQGKAAQNRFLKLKEPGYFQKSLK